MPVYTEPDHLGDLLLVEVAENYTKQVMTLASTAADLPMGTVLTKLSSGKLSPVVLTASNGTEKPYAVLAEKAPINAGDQSKVVIPRGATLNKAKLVWPAGATDVQIAAALDVLDARGIVALSVY